MTSMNEIFAHAGEARDAWKTMSRLGTQLEAQGIAEKSESLQYQGKVIRAYSEILKVICENEATDSNIVMMSVAMGFQSIIMTLMMRYGEPSRLRENIGHFLDTLRDSFSEAVSNYEMGLIKTQELNELN